VLGAIGLALLVYTVISLLQKIEAAFNHVWRVARPRPFSQRFSQYLSVLVIGPVLVFAALGVTATLLNASVVQALATIEPFGTAIETLGRLVPYLLVIGAFAFIYVFIPNTRVRLSSALVGAVVAGLLWQSVGWGFATFVADSPKYFAIYAGFAIVIVAMIWLYLAWLIVLFGSSLAFYHQHPEYLAVRRREPRLSNRQREQLALRVIGLVGNSYYRNATPWSLDTLAHRLHVPQVSVEELLRNLAEAGFLAETTAEPPRYLPARAFETVPVTELLEAVRRADEEPAVGIESEAPVERCVARIGSAVNEALHDQTLRDLAGDVVDKPPGR
jgi:membrane protein